MTLEPDAPQHYATGAAMPRSEMTDVATGAVEDLRPVANPDGALPKSSSGAAPDTNHAINQRIFETSLDLILVVDRQGTFIRVSPSSLAILGYKPIELIGRSAAEFLYREDLDNT